MLFLSLKSQNLALIHPVAHLQAIFLSVIIVLVTPLVLGLIFAQDLGQYYYLLWIGGGGFAAIIVVMLFRKLESAVDRVFRAIFHV